MTFYATNKYKSFLRDIMDDYERAAADAHLRYVRDNQRGGASPPRQKPYKKAGLLTGQALQRRTLPPKHAGQALLMIPKISDISANTINMWIRPPTLYTNTPKSQPMRSMTAIR